MAVETPYTTEELIRSLIGTLGMDLRLDDSPDAANDLQDAIDVGTSDLDFYLSRYAAADIADSVWAQWHATYFAVRFLCERRLNEVPTGLEAACERRMVELTKIQEGKAKAPRMPNTRRPIAVSNYNVDLRKFNNKIRTDRSQSTGVAQDYNRPIDETAADDR